MHEVIGHASGKVADHLKGNPQALIKEQFSALEEARADLVALYFLPDPKLAELGLVSAADQPEIVQAEYEAYARNALVQLRRVREGTQIEEDHMRNRQMIVRWLMDNTKAIVTRQREGKTFYTMVDARAFTEGVGRLLAEVQRIKGEGDYAAAKKLFETYGVHFDPQAARRGRGARRQAEPAVVQRVRHAEARGGHRPGRRRHRRQDLLPARSDDADARVFRCARRSQRTRDAVTMFDRMRGAAFVADPVTCSALAGLPAVAGLRRRSTGVIERASASARTADRRGCPRSKAADLARLTTALRDPSPATQRQAVRALGRLERPDLVETIAPMFRDADPGVRAAAATAIAQSLMGLTAPGSSGYSRVRGLGDADRPGGRREGPGGLGSDADRARPPAFRSGDGHRGRRTALDVHGSRRHTPDRSIVRAGCGPRPRVAVSPAPAHRADVGRNGRRPARGCCGAAQRTRPARRGDLPSRRSRVPNGSTRATIGRALNDADDQVRRLAAVAAGAVETLDGRADLLRRALDDGRPWCVMRRCAPGADGSRRPTAARFATPSPMRMPTSRWRLWICWARRVQILRLRSGCWPNGRTTRNWHHAAHAVVSLARISKDDALPRLERFATHPTWQVRMYAARAAGRSARSTTLRRLAGDDADNVREAALAELRTASGHDADTMYVAALARPTTSSFRPRPTRSKNRRSGQDATAALSHHSHRLTAQASTRLAGSAHGHRQASRGAGVGHRCSGAPRMRRTTSIRTSPRNARPVLSGWTGQTRTARPSAPKGRRRAGHEPRALRHGRERGANQPCAAPGHLNCASFADEAPMTVDRFVRLARAGYYNGLTFHRVVPNFVIQGGSPGANEYMGDA